MVNKTGVRNTILTVIAFAAWLAYILACAPAFSPDDTKVLFPSIDPRTGATTLAMYDRTSQATRTLLVPRDSRQRESVGESHDGMSLASAWSPDGQQAIALWAESKEDLRVAVIPIAGREPVRLIDVPDMDNATDVVLRAPAILGGRLVVSTKKAITRVDLLTGDRTSGEGGGAEVQARGGRLYYARDLPRESDKAPQKWEFGRLDADTLAMTPVLQSEEKVSGFFAVSGDGARLAIEQEGDDDTWSVLVFAGPRLERRIPLGTKQAPVALFNMIWSATNAVLYATYQKVNDNLPDEFGVAEVALDGTPPRYTPLFSASISLDNSGGVFQLDLSHDGRTLAAASTFLGIMGDDKGRMRPEDLALYLVDLSRPDRRVTKVAIPLPPPEKTAAGK